MINPVSSVSFLPSVGTISKKSQPAVTAQTISNSEPASVSAMQALSQMPNVKFGNHYGGDDLSAYDNYFGPEPPDIEKRKYQISVETDRAIRNGDYLTGVKNKVYLADICRAQGKYDDADKLMAGARLLAEDVPAYQREEAWKAINSY